MGVEKNEQFREIKKLGNIEIEKLPEGRIIRINELSLQLGDKIIVVQRHQKPSLFSKEQLLRSAPEGIKGLLNLDYAYDPEIAEEGTKDEENLLSECQEIFGKMNLTAATPRKRGSEHKKLLDEKFSDSQKDITVDQLLDDSGLGLVGESNFNAYAFNLDETKKYFRQKASIPWEFQQSSYMEIWVKLGYRNPDSRWKVENPEELCERTRQILEKSKEKNFFITHEANCVSFHLIARRSSGELRELLSQIKIPPETHNDIEPKLEKLSSILELFKLIKQSLAEHPIKGYHYKKALISLLENIKLKSGNKGYGAISIYVLRENNNGEKILLEPAYDIQASKNSE